jgi:hypothetical protein
LKPSPIKRHRNRERAAVPRAEGSVGAADGDE